MTPFPLDDAVRRALRDLHYASQLVATAGQTLLEPDPSFHHSSTTFEKGVVIGTTLPDDRVARLVMRSMVLSVGEEQLQLRGTPMSDALVWLEKTLGRKLDVPEWELPDGPTRAYGSFTAGIDELAQVSRLYTETQALLKKVIAAHPKASPARLWPHHFDLATSIALEEQTSEEARSVGVGLAPGDAVVADPYLYANPWPYPEGRPTPPLPSGRWQTQPWFGAVLEAKNFRDEAASWAFVSTAISLGRDLAGLKAG